MEADIHDGLSKVSIIELNYTNEENIYAESTYGKVHKIINNGEYHALKKYKNINDCDQIIEYIIMKYLSSCQNVAHVYDLLYTSHSYGLLMPYYEHTLDSIDPTPSNIMECLKQLMHFAHILNNNGIIHRDLKLCNIMVDNDGYIKVIDFGMACYRSLCMDHNVVTIWYRAPEILNNKSYNCKSDWWSIGILICQLILRRPLFSENEEKNMINEIKKFNVAQKRFKKELRQLKLENKDIQNYKPIWPYLKILKELYLFSIPIYKLLMNLLQFNVKKRQILPIDKLPTYKHKNIAPLVNLSQNQGYRINIPTLNMYSTKYISSEEPKSIIYHECYKNYNELLYISDEVQSNLIYIDNYIGHEYVDIFSETDSCLLNLFEQQLYIYDTYLDVLVNGLYIFNSLTLLIHKNATLKKSLHLLLSDKSTSDMDDNLKPEHLTDLLKICISLSHEITDDYYQENKYFINREFEKSTKNFSIKQLVIDYLKQNIKQNRTMFHTAHNLEQFNQYNTLYNMIYLMDPSIWIYKYNYVICHLQIYKHGKKQSMLPSFVPNIFINRAIKNFFELGWDCIKSSYKNNIHVNQSLINGKCYYYTYKKSARRNNRLNIM